MKFLKLKDDNAFCFGIGYYSTLAFKATFSDLRVGKGIMIFIGPYLFGVGWK